MRWLVKALMLSGTLLMDSARRVAVTTTVSSPPLSLACSVAGACGSTCAKAGGAEAQQGECGKRDRKLSRHHQLPGTNNESYPGRQRRKSPQGTSSCRLISHALA